MKNLNKVRTYWGYNFIFEDSEMAWRFILLFEDMFEHYVYKPDKHVVSIQVKKGVISKIKESLGDLVTCKHKRYYVKKAA